MKKVKKLSTCAPLINPRCLSVLCIRVRERTRFQKTARVRREGQITKNVLATREIPDADAFPMPSRCLPDWHSPSLPSSNPLSDSRAIDLSRARDVARTTRHARHVTHDTSRTHASRARPRHFAVGITPPTSDFLALWVLPSILPSSAQYHAHIEARVPARSVADGNEICATKGNGNE